MAKSYLVYVNVFVDDGTSFLGPTMYEKHVSNTTSCVQQTCPVLDVFEHRVETIS